MLYDTLKSVLLALVVFLLSLGAGTIAVFIAVLGGGLTAEQVASGIQSVCDWSGYYGGALVGLCSTAAARGAMPHLLRRIAAHAVVLLRPMIEALITEKIR